MRKTSVVFLLIYWITSCVVAQEKYDNCGAALAVCPNDTITVNNYAATSTKCTNCEDDIAAISCFQPKNSIWLTFTTNALGGDVQVKIGDISYKTNPNQASVLHAALLKAALPCDPTTYTFLGNCVSNGTTDIIISATNLPANTTYFVIVSGGISSGTSIPAEAQMRVHLTGAGVARVKPEISIVSPKQTVCQKETVRLDCQLVDCADSTKYSWFINDTLVAKTDSAYYTTNRLKEGDIVRVSNACFSTCRVEISAQSSPFKVIDFIVDAGKDTTIHAGESVVLQGVTQGDSFYWNSLFGNITSLQPTVSPVTTTTYTLSSSYLGCTLYDAVQVKVLRTNLEAVTSFSPNGDGINDTWLIPSLEDYPNCEMKIYSRWGQPVFETTGYTLKKSWDGTYNGSIVDEGVYFYVIHLRDLKYNAPIQGTVTVVR